MNTVILEPDPTGPEWSCSEKSEFTTLKSTSGKSATTGLHTLTSVADPHHLKTDPGPACHFDADPDPACHFDADPDPEPTYLSI
jgi:hypothetical protein